MKVKTVRGVNYFEATASLRSSESIARNKSSDGGMDMDQIVTPRFDDCSDLLWSPKKIVQGLRATRPCNIEHRIERYDAVGVILCATSSSIYSPSKPAEVSRIRQEKAPQRLRGRTYNEQLRHVC